MRKLLFSSIAALLLFVTISLPLNLQAGNKTFAIAETAYADCGALQSVCDSLGSTIESSLTGITNGIFNNLVEIILNRLTGSKATATSIHPNSTQPPPTTLTDFYNQYGAIGAISLGIGSMFDHQPVITSDYLASLHPIVPVYADSGCNDSKPPTKVCGMFGQTIILFWTASRNLAYIFFILVMVTIGFMIMFRSKIDPRTTITVTAAIPNLIISLVLITFSLAIAGLLINIGQVLMDVVKNIMTTTILTQSALIPASSNSQVNLSVGDILASFIFNGNNYLTALGSRGDIAIGIFVALIIAVIVFVVAIMLFVTLLTRYVNLLIKPIYAPFVFLFGAIPGRGDLTVNWFKGYLVDVLTFPLILIMLNLAMSIKISTGIGQQGDPFGITGVGANLTPLIVAGILIMATKVPHMLESALDVKPDSHVAKGGADAASIAKKTPFIGGFFK